MAKHSSRIVRFEVAPGAGGEPGRVFLACTMSSDAAPEGETRYWEHWLTPEQVAAFEAADDREAYVRGLVPELSRPVHEAWLAEMASRPPEPKRYAPEEIEAAFGKPVAVADRKKRKKS